MRGVTLFGSFKNYMFDSKRPALKANKRPRTLKKVNMGSLQSKIVEGSFMLGLAKFCWVTLFENEDYWQNNEPVSNLVTYNQ